MLITNADERSLERLGAEAVKLLCARDFNGLAERFGYALAFGRAPADAIQQDLHKVLEEAGGATISRDAPAISVKPFKPNKDNMFAVVECRLQLSAGRGTLLVELIAFGDGPEWRITFEQISHFENQ